MIKEIRCIFIILNVKDFGLNINVIVHKVYWYASMLFHHFHEGKLLLWLPVCNPGSIFLPHHEPLYLDPHFLPL